MPNLDQDKLRSFLGAMVANGTRPSPSLIRAIATLSGDSEEKVEDLCRELFEAAEIPFVTATTDHKLNR